MTKKKPSKTKSRDKDVSGPRIISIPLDQIKIEPGRRDKCSDKEVNDMVTSVLDNGRLINPVTVVRTGENDDGDPIYSLLAGVTRFMAVERLGEKKIDAIVIKGSKDQRELCEVDENLIRKGLRALDRFELIARRAVITERLQDAHGALPGGKQPNERGISKTAKLLNLSRRMVERSLAAAELSEDVKTAAREAKLDNSTRALMEIAKEETPEKQLEKVEEIRIRKEKAAEEAQGQREQPEVESPALASEGEEETNWDAESEEASDDTESLDDDEIDSDFEKLKSAWKNSAQLKKAWKAASASTRKRFAKDVLGLLVKAAAHA